MKLTTAASIVLWLTVVKTTVTATGPTVLTSLGELSGFERISRGGRVFQGWTKIPYAKPPVNNLRFLPPQAPDSWQGILDATQNAPACLQNGIFPKLARNVLGTEDCLYLNVYRPKEPTLKQMPVLVYVHGGAFLTGMVGGGQNADYFMDEDIVFVEVSYRLNVFGFMSLNDEVLPGNNGMKDQARALRWIKDNIDVFGGDPNKITVFGESAGGSSVHLLLKSPLSKDLIQGAVSHSGTMSPVWSLVSADSVKELTLQTGEIVGCKQSSSVELLKCLQGVDGKQLLQAYSRVSKWPIHSGFAPVIEPKTAKDAFATEDFSLTPTSKPWINTITNGEYSLFTTMLKMVPNAVTEAFRNTPDFLKGILPIGSTSEQQELAVTLLEKTYLIQKSARIETFTLEIAKMLADEGFTYPALVATEKHGGPTWLGLLEYSPFRKIDEAPHAANIQFYFNRTNTFPAAASPLFVNASKRMIKYLVNFANYSDPTPPGSSVVWPQFKTNEILRMTRKGDFVGEPSVFNNYQKMKNTWDLVTNWR